MWAIVVAAVTSLYMLLTGNIKCKSPFHLKGFSLSIEYLIHKIFRRDENGRKRTVDENC